MPPSVIIKIAVMTTLFVFVHVALLLVWCKCRKRRTPQPSTRPRLSFSLCLTPTRMSGETVVAHPFTAHVTTDDDVSKDIADEAVRDGSRASPRGTLHSSFRTSPTPLSTSMHLLIFLFPPEHATYSSPDSRFPFPLLSMRRTLLLRTGLFHVSLSSTTVSPVSPRSDAVRTCLRLLQTWAAFPRFPFTPPVPPFVAMP
ncbi:hypothetical protein C8J57DRAFT_1616690 [Mycena rebaudengoi]|nr:hypothetical protein C8J57DRAFT_1616690 [Mycena rebaudengoi]